LREDSYPGLNVSQSVLLCRFPSAAEEENRAEAYKKKQKHLTNRIVQHCPVFTLQVARPLGIGMREQMIADAEARGLDITVSHIKQGLYDYINRRVYLKALIPGGSRFDMTGQPNGEVTPEQQQDAQRKLDKRDSAKTAQPVNEVSR